jgi:DNA end-binding protein Ku
VSARAIWKGVIVVGTTRVPVRLLSAVQDRDVHFRLLHAEDRAPVRQSMVNPQTGTEVPRDEIRKGYEVERGVFVVLGKAELDALAPEASRDMAVEQVVPRGAVGSYWYERPYWLAPDGKAGADYAALAAALERAERDAVVRWVMRGEKRVGVLRAREGRLVLVTLRQADEVVPPDDLEPPAGGEPAAKEVRLAEQLVGALEGPFEPEAYRDEYQERVRKLIDAKAKGRRIPRAAAPRPKPASGSLTRALEASLRGTEKGRRRA